MLTYFASTRVQICFSFTVSKKTDANKLHTNYLIKEVPSDHYPNLNPKVLNNEDFFELFRSPIERIRSKESLKGCVF